MTVIMIALSLEKYYSPLYFKFKTNFKKVFDFLLFVGGTNFKRK